jgi:hypothetical protein
MMSVMSNLHLDISEMLEAGCSYGFITHEIMTSYGLTFSEARMYVNSVQDEMANVEESYDY